jgi:hypothetical protein
MRIGRRVVIGLLVLLWASAASAQSLTLVWGAVTTNEDQTPIADLDHYNIYRCTLDAGGRCPSPPVFLISVPAPATTYQDTTISATNRYRYEVTAVNSAGAESSRSGAITARAQKFVIISP